MKKITFIFSFLLIAILSGCGGNSNSSANKEDENLEIQMAEEAQKNSEEARKSAEETEKEINKLLK